MPSVAVLGGGIMGASAALHLARAGASVSLFEREAAPFEGASRWNEGKIHLGFLYAGDPSLETARSVLDGGLDFAGQVDRLTGASVRGRMTEADDVYLIHRDSVASAKAIEDYFGRLADLVRSHPSAGSYLCDASACRVERLGRQELAAMTDPEAIVAGFRVPERSVETAVVADAFVAALHTEPGVELACGVEVSAVDCAADGWSVVAGGERHGPFDAVVNALWEGRPRLDRSVGHRPDSAEHHRFRVSVFAHTESSVEVPSAVVAVGGFGDMKNYGGRSFYVSWYEAGLLASADGIDPPPAPDPGAAERSAIAAATFAGLGALMPAALAVEQAATEVRVEGGWVYSQGRGRLDDPHASVHRRASHRISNMGSYFSVDTGKYSVAPTRAEELAQRVLEIVR